jgi:peptidyl-prolyl cis-trans isomerase B (cyclophilin B)
MMRSILAPFGLFLVLGFAAGAQPPPENSPAPPDRVPPAPSKTPQVMLHTSQGDIVLELDAEKAPLTVANFLQYVDDGHFNGTIFHRVINGFMIQGGGFTRDMAQKTTRGPVRNEADNGLKNKRGTMAMARTADIHSATAQFFINVADNTFLDHTSSDPRGFGYCVFGRVIEGMDVVDRIKSVPTGHHGPHGDVPVEPIEIIEASRK